MATKLTTGKIEREVRARSGDLIARVTPEGVYMKEKGRRTWYPAVSWDSIYGKGAELKAKADRDEREQNKKVRRVSRGLLSTK